MRQSVRAGLVLGLTIVASGLYPARGQQGAGVNPMANACGSEKIKFNVERDSVNPPAQSPPEGKALVYVMEVMPGVLFLSTKVRVGVDGAWVGGLDYNTYTAFSLDPGVHHLCMSYEGEFAQGEQGAVILRKLDVKAGHTYYLQYHGIFSKTDGEVAFFDPVDEDEGEYLRQTLTHATSKPKK